MVKLEGEFEKVTGSDYNSQKHSATSKIILISLKGDEDYIFGGSLSLVTAKKITQVVA